MVASRYLTAKEAAAALGVSLPTLYAYVSRGLIRSEATEGKSRTRRYRQEDVRALLARKALRQNPARATEEALHGGGPVLESAITLIDNGRLYYRGRDVLALPANHTFADVAGLIWQGELTQGAQFETDIAPLWAGIEPFWPQLAQQTPVERCQAVLPLAQPQDLAAYDLRPAAVIQTGGRILHLMAAAVSGGPAPDPIPQALQQTWRPEETAVIPLLAQALIFCADHELNASAFAARVVASARATPYAVVIAGLAALQGSLHGGATERVDAFLREVGTPAQAPAVIASRLRRGETIPGFSHPLYPQGDPRGRELLAATAAVYPEAPAVRLVQQVRAEVETAVGLLPTIDLALVALAWAAGLPPGAPLALFAIGRTVGWIGHALEQYGRDQLIRPRARYTGALPEPDQG